MNFSLNAYRVGVQKKFTNQKSSLFHCIKEDIELFGHGISITSTCIICCQGMEISFTVPLRL